MLVTALAMPDEPVTIGPDWCWQHYALAPASALVTDHGPPSADAADEWLTWLAATVDAPAARRHAHAAQLELVEELRSAGAWTATEARRYREAAASDPTPATVCETFGARIIPEPDGSLPPRWADRFTDAQNAAFSQLAGSEGEAR